MLDVHFLVAPSNVDRHMSTLRNNPQSSEAKGGGGSCNEGQLEMMEKDGGVGGWMLRAPDETVRR